MVLTERAVAGSSPQNGLDFWPKARIGVVMDRWLNASGRLSGSPRRLRGLGWWERQSGRSATIGAQSHDDKLIRNFFHVEALGSPRDLRSATRHNHLAIQKSPKPAREVRESAEKPRRTHVTKHARLLDLLSQPEGATIEEMMQATNWQQHSVRGFLAGTVKKKLGLELTSSKPDGEARRYRIARRRGR